MATPLIEHLLRSGPAIEPHADIPIHNTRVIEAHALLLMAIASDLEREFGQPILWSGTRHLPYPGNTPPSAPHFTLGSTGPRIHIAYEINSAGHAVLFGENPATPLLIADDKPQTTS